MCRTLNLQQGRISFILIEESYRESEIAEHFNKARSDVSLVIAYSLVAFYAESFANNAGCEGYSNALFCWSSDIWDFRRPVRLPEVILYQENNAYNSVEYSYGRKYIMIANLFLIHSFRTRIWLLQLARTVSSCQSTLWGSYGSKIMYEGAPMRRIALTLLGYTCPGCCHSP